MKKTLILLFALLLLLSSCKGATDSGGATTMDETTTEPLDTTSYEDIERRQAAGYKTYHYSFKNDRILLRIKHPTEWSLTETAEGFAILRDGEMIGSLVGAPSDDVATFTPLKTESHSIDGVYITKYIEQRNGNTEFRYRFVYEYPHGSSTRTVTLTAACREIDGQTEKKLYSEAITVDKISSPTLGELHYSLKNPSSILILGNSFIGSSDVGDILTEMLENEGKDCSVTAIATGFARVGTYANDKALLERIRDGMYDAVFICGLYSTKEVENIGILKEACDESDTELVIFPAHNENASAVSTAEEEYPALFLLDWKSELDGLIQNGVSRWDLCIDDEHYHSTQLAGYVGAHMIYRSIYDELPTEPMRYILSQEYIDYILGDYAYVGDSHFFDEDKISYLN